MEWTIARVYEFLPNPYVNDVIHVVMTNGTQERSLLMKTADFQNFERFWEVAKNQANIVLVLNATAPPMDVIKDGWFQVTKDHLRQFHESN
jgi:hypothetical protein